MAGRPTLRLVAFPRKVQGIYPRVASSREDLPHPKENTMTTIAELSLEQIDSLFGLDNAPDIKADEHGHSGAANGVRGT